MNPRGIRFASLGSGSKGNATLVCAGTTRVLVDCGFTLKETCQRLERLGVAPASLTALLVTHEHADHIGGIGPLARRYRLPVYTTTGTRLSSRIGELPSWQVIDGEQPFAIQDLQVQPVVVPHDAREPVQFVFSEGSVRLGLLTDLGSITPHVLQQYQQCQGLIVEANHDPQMLQAGPYPASLKRRVAGDYGHLSNQQTAAFLQQLDTRQLQHLVASHLSETNNLPQLAGQVLAEALNTTPGWITLADQQQGLDWRQLAS